MPTLKFDEPTHTYTLDGKVLPSVTQVLKPLYDFSGVPAEVLERKRQIGTAVHKAIELDLADDLDPASLAPEVAPYFAAWQSFRAQFRPIEYRAEALLYSALGYAGTVDLIARQESAPTPWVIDYKTATVVSQAVALQTAAYTKAAIEAGLVTDAARRATLHLRPDGTYRLITHNDRADLRVFQALLIVHQWRQANGC